MATHVPCKKNDTNGYIFYVSLVSQADTKVFQANPTLAAGDVKIAVDDAAPGNLGTLPAVDADFTKRVKVTLSQAETNGDNLTVIFSDAAGDEWCDLTINIQTSAQTLDEIDTNVDDIETDTGTTLPATLATIAGYIDTEVASILAAVDTEIATLLTRLSAARAGYLDELAAANVPADVDTLLTRITAAVALEATLTTMKQKAAGAFDRETDSLEAIRDRGDAAWVTGGGALTDILNIEPLIPIAIDLADTIAIRLGLALRNALDDLPTAGEITQGTISIDRKAIGGTSWVAVVTDVACLEAAGLIYYDEVFDRGTGYREGDSIRITFKNQKITVAANDYEITGATGWSYLTYIRDSAKAVFNLL